MGKREAMVEEMARAMWDCAARNRNALWDMDWKDGAGPSPSERVITRARAQAALTAISKAAGMSAASLRGCAATLRARKMGVAEGNPRLDRERGVALFELLAEAAPQEARDG